WARLIETVERAVLERYTERDPIEANDRYMLLQSVVGALPLEATESAPAPAAIESFRERLHVYAQKALREAKRHTSWINPDEAYEERARDFLALLLDSSAAPWQAILPLVRELSARGMLNGLTRTILKATLPGVPDFYQGTEFWDFSLVDPDNRRPVDYEQRERLLHELQARAADTRSLAQELLHTSEDGRVKLYVSWQCLQCRREYPGLFTAGN